MPEYLAPGVYVEEVSYRAKSIEGVSTTVTGFIGPTRYGPVGGEPELLTSFADFERIYGGIDSLVFSGDGDDETQHNFMAHGVRAFFDNGGTKLYVSRVYEYDTDDTDPDPDLGKAFGTGSPPLVFARFPGSGGNMRITFTVKVGPNVLTADTGGNTIVSGLTNHDLVFINQVPTGSPPTGPTADPVAEGFYDVTKDDDGVVTFDNAGTTGTVGLDRFDARENYSVHLVTVIVSVRRPGRFSSDELIGEFSFGPGSRNSLSNYFQDEPESRNRYLHVPFAIRLGSIATGSALAEALLGGTMADVLVRQVAGPDEREAFSPPRNERPSPSELTVV
ncbi:MAG TPA: hypothetical protein VGB98_20310, partial [Pyrinomonadaceae bacterium]